MKRNTARLTAIAVAVIAAVAGADSAPAAERVATGDIGSYSAPSGFGLPAKTISNDTTSRFVSLVINKSMALDLPRDVSDVFIGNEKIANAILRTKRRVYIVGKGFGQTNVYFYDAKGQQIDGLNVNVLEHDISERIAAREIVVVRGKKEGLEPEIQIYECTPSCSIAENATPEKTPQPIFVLPNVTSLSRP